MPSRLSGYSYDVFISYRQKDNLSPDKSSLGWVTEFVARLRQEIQSTIKDEISIYFDENPTDRILPTHDVDDTVKAKIKCLILVPIVSQIYCDTKSFAWNFEFLAFKSFVNQDPIGPKVQLQNGNVASRIIPVCIHDLDPQDRQMIEAEIGPLRSVDFTFRSPGVNRPLTPSDKREDTLSHTLYKDQINQLANAIKDIVRAIETSPEEKIRTVFTKPDDNAKQKVPRKVIIGGIAGSILVLLAVIYFMRPQENAAIEKSIAVLPFVDMTSSQDLEYLGDGIAEEIINSLTSIVDLKIIGRTSSFQFKGQNLDLREIGKKLNVATILEGSIQRSGNKMRITAQLIRTSDNTHIFSKHYDVEETDIFEIQDNIASSIVEMLNITLSANEEDRLVKKQTTEEAYTIYLKALFQYKRENYKDAKPLFEEVLSKDSLYAPAHAYLALSKTWIGIRGRTGGTPSKDDEATLDAIKSAKNAIRLDPMLPEGYSCLALIAWAIEHDFGKARDYFDESLKLDPGSSLIKNRYGYFLTWMGDFNKARALAKEAMSIDPVDYNSYVILYAISFYSEDFTSAHLYQRELNNLAGRGNMPTIELIFSDRDFNKVNRLCDSLRSAGKELSDSDLSYNAMAYFALHQLEKSNEQIRLLIAREHRTQSNARFNVARVYAFRNERDSVFSNLNKSATKREINFIRLKIDYAFKDFRADPRYIELYNKLGFDKY